MEEKWDKHQKASSSYHSYHSNHSDLISDPSPFKAKLENMQEYNRQYKASEVATKEYEVKKSQLVQLQSEYKDIKPATTKLELDKHTEFKQAVDVEIAKEKQRLQTGKNKVLTEINEMGSVWTNNTKELEAQGFKDLANHTKKARLTGGIVAGAVALASIVGTAVSISKGNETEKTMQAKLASMRKQENLATEA